MIAPESSYQTGSPELWVIFDVRDERAVENLHLLRGVLQEFSDLEFIDEEHAVLIAWPGGARRLEA
jgi:hypothetical protein